MPSDGKRQDKQEVVGGKPQTMREVLHQHIRERVLLGELNKRRTSSS